VSRWRSYWNAPGGRTSCACLRIAIACSLLFTLARMEVHAVDARSNIYYAHGIWLLYPGRPPAHLLELLEVVAWVATAALLVGAWTRWSHALSLIAVLALATYEASSKTRWSHQSVPPVLASLAFVCARGGDALSVDAWFRRRRALPARDVASGYQASVRLVQLVVASVFFMAAIWKLRNGGVQLGWVFSDNLRHQLLARFDWCGLDRTAAADWLLARSWRYETCALLNVLSQLAPMAAVVAIERPRVRAALAGVWLAEVVGLGVVMAYWNLHWIPLAAAFIDWDRLVGASPRVEPVPARPAPRFVLGFLVFYGVQALVLDQRLNIYPFSSFPMFAEIRAKRPFSRHQSYEFVGARVELVAAGPEAQAWAEEHIAWRELWRERDPSTLRSDLQRILADAHTVFPTSAPRGVRLWVSVGRVPAYPAPARIDREDVALVAELIDGRFQTMIGTAEQPVEVVELPPCLTIALDGVRWLVADEHE
jgi:hypothetical protein